jgi:hypothetical protein
VSEFTPGQPLIQVGLQGGSSAKPGSNKNYVKPMGEEVEIDEDWQKVNRQDKTDGLSQKAVDAYRRENPGSLKNPNSALVCSLQYFRSYRYWLTLSN